MVVDTRIHLSVPAQEEDDDAGIDDDIPDAGGDDRKHPHGHYHRSHRGTRCCVCRFPSRRFLEIVCSLVSMVIVVACLSECCWCWGFMWFLLAMLAQSGLAPFRL